MCCSLMNDTQHTYSYCFTAIIRSHRMHTVHRCGLLLQMSHIACMVCVYVSICPSVYELVTQMCLSGADSCVSKEPCTRLGVNIGRIHSQLQWVPRRQCGRLPNYFGLWFIKEWYMQYFLIHSETRHTLEVVFLQQTNLFIMITRWLCQYASRVCSPPIVMVQREWKADAYPVYVCCTV